MSKKTLLEKLYLKAGYRVLFLNVPEDYMDRLNPLPSDLTMLTKPTGEIDFIQVFVKTQAEIEDLFPKLKSVLAPKGLLWVTYPKGTSKVKTDLNRDSIYEYGLSIGLQGVAIVSIDNVWSGLRMKHKP